MTTDRIDYWSCEGSDYLEIEQGDAISDYLEGILPGRPLADWPETVEVQGWRRCEMQMPRVLEWVLEQLDADFADPDGEPTKPTPKMLEAEAAFRKVVAREYGVPWRCEECGPPVPWRCEECGPPETVDVLQWVQENEPEWIEEAKAVSLEGRLKHARSRASDYQDLLAERDGFQSMLTQAQRELAEERHGVHELRARYGAGEHETYAEFVARLGCDRDTASAHVLALEAELAVAFADNARLASDAASGHSDRVTDLEAQLAAEWIRLHSVTRPEDVSACQQWGASSTASATRDLWRKEAREALAAADAAADAAVAK